MYLYIFSFITSFLSLIVLCIKETLRVKGEIISMTLKHVYMIKMNLYLYDVKNFLPFLMWSIINIIDTIYLLYSTRLLDQTENHLIWGQTNPHLGLISFVTTHFELYKYCMLWVKSDHHSFKMHLHS